MKNNMWKYFEVGTPLYFSLAFLGDLLLYSFLFYVCSLPIITIGSSLSSVFYIMRRRKNKQEIGIQYFFKSFKNNFFYGIISTIIFLPLLYFSIINLKHGFSIFNFIILSILITVFLNSVYLISKYEFENIGILLINSLKIAFSKLLLVGYIFLLVLVTFFFIRKMPIILLFIVPCVIFFLIIGYEKIVKL